MKRVLSESNGVREVFHSDAASGKIHIETKQDVSGILEANKQARNNQSENWKGDMHKVADIPMVTIQMWNKKYGCNVLKPENRHLIMLELNHSDNTLLRTKTGRI